MKPSRPTKACLVGFAPIKDVLPWGERGTEFWGFNELYRRYPNVKDFHRWFELHVVTHDEPGLVPGYFGTDEWARHATVLREIAQVMPLYTPLSATVPHATIYPLAKVEALPHGQYHAGTFDWMVALAIVEGFKEIHVYGADFATGGEPISARPCLEYWLGLAEGRGIQTVVHGGDCFRIFHLTKSDRQYGFERFALVDDA